MSTPTINSQRLPIIPVPFDSKRTNCYVSGSDIVIETIAQYLLRVTTDIRDTHIVTMIIPKVGFEGSEGTYPLINFDATLANFDTKQYSFIGGLGDGDFTEVISGINTGDQTSVLLNGTGVYALPSIVDNGDGTVTLGSGDYVFAQNADGTAPFLKYTITGAAYSLTDGVTNYIVANYNAGSPTITVVTSTSTINNTIVIPIFTIFRTGTHLDILNWDEAAKAPTGKLQRRIVRTQRFAVEPGGLILGEVATNDVTVTSGNVWNGLHQNAIPSFNSVNSGTDFLRLYAHIAGVYTKSTITAYNNTQYDDGTDLQTLVAGRYAVNWIFRAVNDNENEVYIVLGNGNYTLAQAQASQVPSTLPVEISSTAILVGRIIVQKSAATATQIDSAFVQNFNQAPTNDHNLLSNLQGGTTNEYYHITAAQAVVVGNTSGANSGNETAASIIALNIDELEYSLVNAYLNY